MDFSNIACWVWPLIAGIVCGIFGYFLGSLSSKDNDSSEELERLERKNAQLEADLRACNVNLKAAPPIATSSISMASSFATTTKKPSKTKEASFDAAAAKAAFGKKIKENDLTLVEGIGPKISELFHNHGVTTWAELGNTAVDKCQKILNSGGKRYEIHRPGSWPMQAEMAAAGKWSELKNWQDEHDYGKA
tara:strand:- start:2492 stop:3064 length:573 start_codon:yes stop_codon:yes gene_type:complete